MLIIEAGSKVVSFSKHFELKTDAFEHKIRTWSWSECKFSIDFQLITKWTCSELNLAPNSSMFQKSFN